MCYSTSICSIRKNCGSANRRPLREFLKEVCDGWFSCPKSRRTFGCGTHIRITESSIRGRTSVDAEFRANAIDPLASGHADGRFDRVSDQKFFSVEVEDVASTTQAMVFLNGRFVGYLNIGDGFADLNLSMRGGIGSRPLPRGAASRFVVPKMVPGFCPAAFSRNKQSVCMKRTKLTGNCPCAFLCAMPTI